MQQLVQVKMIEIVFSELTNHHNWIMIQELICKQISQFVKWIRSTEKKMTVYQRTDSALISEMFIQVEGWLSTTTILQCPLNKTIKGLQNIVI